MQLLPPVFPQHSSGYYPAYRRIGYIAIALGISQGNTGSLGGGGPGGSGPVPPGSFTYHRPDGISLYIRPTDPMDTYLRP